MRIVSCNIKGPSTATGKKYFGLGNQLFCISTTYAYALKYNLKAVFPQLKDTSTYGNYVDNIFKKVDLTNNIEFQRCHVYNSDNLNYSEIPSPEELDKNKNILLNGHFEDERYFSNFRKEILELFKLPKEQQEKIEQKYKELLSKNTVGIHVRRGDFLHLQHIHPVQNIKYYEEAIKHFDSNSKFVIFSDDIEWCKQNLNFLDPFYVSDEKEDLNSYFGAGTLRDINDLYLMTKMKNIIIANSTFSWWGAWLNENEGKIIAPKNWYGPSAKPDADKNKIPKNWLRI